MDDKESAFVLGMKAGATERIAELEAEVERLLTNQIPELNDKERKAMDSLPDDLVNRLMAGEQWSSEKQCYIPTREKLQTEPDYQVTEWWELRERDFSQLVPCLIKELTGE